MKSYPGPPMTLGNAAAARVRLMVWRKECQHRVEPDPAEQITSAMFTEMAAPKRPCSIGASAGLFLGGSRQADMVARVKCARGPLLPPRIMSPQTVHCSSLVVAPTEGGPSGPQCPSKGLPSTGVAA
jgi:hypothetical protein